MNAPSRPVHLLYVPTLACNLGCSYCYLGTQTTEAKLKEDSARAVSTLRHALTALDEAGVLAFNVSLHGGEVTTLPPAVLDELFSMVRAHYLKHFDAISALGHKKLAPHIKTNLYKFAPLYDLFDRHKVSISASIDLPLKLHEEHRRTLGGKGWRDLACDNLRRLAAYPHAKKISATLAAEHLADLPALIDDIWYIHRDLGFDMNQMNLMFAFPSALNTAARGNPLAPADEATQLALYDALNAAFAGTELEEGLRRNWFDEFTPSYCTNAINCGERFYLLQSDGNVYSCVRGQGLPEFHYGNVFTDSVDTILATGARKIATIHQQFGLANDCRACGHLAQCHSGCAVVKFQRQHAKSYTCQLQKALYRDYPQRFPALAGDEQAAYARHYIARAHPGLAIAEPPPPPAPAALVLPSDLVDAKNGLRALIAADPILVELYRADAWRLELNDEWLALESQILRARADCHTLLPGDQIRLHLRRELFAVACTEPVRNTVYLQVLRDTPVVYGDEQRSKQEHLFTYQRFANCLSDSPLGDDWAMLDLAPLLALHAPLFQRGVRNNLLVTTGYLRDYHYQKQKANAFYHVQAINLPFQNLEFHYLTEA
ncbi:radical SAM protein [Ferribacterium limneticum]|uniref:radical SAM protein n=1 Tax=Ferribacterium limneticum TaxID=76259 RepID=UPI001CFB7DE1|nr:SPASM domain-containing protein [Ferribacterium limneticum]UCV20332.1 radical SAM protein [Ferribacterium limneticum]